MHTNLSVRTAKPESEAAAGKQERARSLGAVYTPDSLAKWVAAEILCRLPTREPIRILDPACGDGVLLAAVAALAPKRVHLIGADVDYDALQKSRHRLQSSTLLFNVDALVPGGRDVTPTVAWESLLGAGSVSGIIANPPWGADLDHSTETLRDMGYELAQGQYDSSDLFLELCISLAPQDAVLGFIVPDSLFQPEHQRLRQLLLGSTTLDLIARLGEGVFPGVYRGTAVVIARKSVPAAGHRVKCMRLTRTWRSAILGGTASYADALEKLGHDVPQRRFERDPQARFDIDVADDEIKTFGKVTSKGADWTSGLESGRGVELSKGGLVVVCLRCGGAKPKPRSNLGSCNFCGFALSAETVEQRRIVQPYDASDGPPWARLIVGEDVDRYRSIASRAIRTDVTGINYKAEETFRRPKLLVRKTGVGLKANIDLTGAFTNQVVFHYTLPKHSGLPDFYLSYVLGVMSSRVMLAYHLKRVGESEWRSHPYVTQRILSELPIPSLDEENSAQAKAISEAVDRLGLNYSQEQDFLVESLVAGLFKLETEDVDWVRQVLESAEALEPIRTLRFSTADRVVPVRV